MNNMRILLLTGILAVGLMCSGGYAGLLPTEALQAATSFCRKIDQAEFDAAYNSASPLLRLAQERGDFTNSVRKSQQLLGAVQQRTLSAVRSVTTFPHLPDGDYLVVQFTARTPLKQEAREVLLLKQEADGSWQVSDYAIR